jgi:hypothetical protein
VEFVFWRELAAILRVGVSEPTLPWWTSSPKSLQAWKLRALDIRRRVKICVAEPFSTTRSSLLAGGQDESAVPYKTQTLGELEVT